MKHFVARVALSLLLVATTAAAQNKLLTLDDIYDPQKKLDFTGSPPTNLRWLKDGQHYVQSKSDRNPERSAPVAGGTGQLLKVHAATGRSEPLFDAAKLEAALARLPGIAAEDARKLARRTSYTFNENFTALLLDHANDLFFWELGSERAVRLTHDAAREEEPAFSPDGRIVSFVRNNNLFVLELANGRERALTADGGPKILNGRLDWVYQEELYGRGNYRGYWWSPDSTRLSYLRLDEQDVKEFAVVDHIPRLQQVETGPYPKAGDPNPKVKLGIVSAAGGRTRWVDTSAYGSDFLIVRVAWTPDSRNIAYQVQNREQNWLDLNFASASDAKSRNVLKETSKAWVEVIDNPHWLKDGSFLWATERGGWEQLYHYAADGRLLRPVTEGHWEVVRLYGVDESQQLVYFQATEHSHIAPHVYRIRLDGSGLARLSQADGTHNANFAPDYAHYIDSWSDINSPVQVRLHTAEGAVVRVIHEGKVDALAQFKLSRPEFVQVKTRDGFPMEAVLIRPADFDAKKKYPVMSFTYGGPHAPMVKNAWGASTYMWQQMLAQKGYAIWTCDNRTASGKGAESVWPVYRNTGELELRDLEDCLGWLKKQPWVDASRIGLWGWSYGGYMVSYAMTHSKSFKIGLAGGSVTDWRLYDTIYTERYMGTPQNNPDGYRKTAPLHAAKDLHGKLLLLHGLTDDNVHVQNTIQFAYELQKAGKRFEMMLYPKSRHAVSEPALIKHMRAVMTDFILENL